MPPYQKNGRKRWYITYRVAGRDQPVTESFATKRRAATRLVEVQAIKESGGAATLSPASPSGLTFAALAERYYSSREFSASTIASDAYRLKVIFEQIGDLQVEALTEEVMAVAIGSWKSKRGNTDRGVFRKWELIRAILRWGVKAKIIAKNPLEGFQPERGRKPVIMPPTREEVEAILDASPPHLVRAILLAFHTGVRVGASELFAMRWSDFDLAAGWVRVRSAEKGGLPWRDVPIFPDFLPLLTEWRAEDGAILWPIHFHGKPVQSVKGAWGGALRRAGIERRIRPYDLRHFFATDLLEQGVDPGVVAGLMGHTTTRMVQDVYQRVRRAGKMDAILKLTRLKRRDSLPKKGNVVAPGKEPVQ